MVERIRTIIDKEWAEVFKNRMVLLTITLLPLIFTIMPLAVLYFTRAGTSGGGGDAADMPAQFAALCGAIPAQDCLQIYMVNQFLLLYMIMPLMIPITIAAYSIVGEKATHSLEPLLATPITTAELLAGKILAAVIPAILATYACFGIFLLVMPLVGASAAVQASILGPTWLLAILVIGPLMAIVAVNFAVIISSRVNDPRVAEQISAVLIVPLLAVMFGQIAGLILINLQMILISIVVFVLLDIGSLYLGVTLFQRENILTRWK
jgi:ABC-2 type transport system permease protein